MTMVVCRLETADHRQKAPPWTTTVRRIKPDEYDDYIRKIAEEREEAVEYAEAIARTLERQNWKLTLSQTKLFSDTSKSTCESEYIAMRHATGLPRPQPIVHGLSRTISLTCRPHLFYESQVQLMIAYLH